MIRQIAVALFVSIALIQPADAEWDLRHASAVEDLLNDYIQTLPGGGQFSHPDYFFTRGKHIREVALVQESMHLLIALQIIRSIWN